MVLSSWRWYIWLLSLAPGGRAGIESPVDHLSKGHQVAECSAPDLASRVNKRASTNGFSSIRKCAKCSLSMVVGAYEAKDWALWLCIWNIETQSIFHNNLLLQSKGLAYISSRSQKLALAVWHALYIHIYTCICIAFLFSITLSQTSCFQWHIWLYTFIKPSYLFTSFMKRVELIVKVNMVYAWKNHCGPFILYRITPLRPRELRWSKTRTWWERGSSSWTRCQHACMDDFLTKAAFCIIIYTSALQMSRSELFWCVIPPQKSLRYRWGLLFIYIYKIRLER